MPKSKQLETLQRYRIFSDTTTRWNDNDVYGHINNAVYNEWMDTAVTNCFRQHLPEYPNSPFIAVAAETCFTFHHSIAHPATVETGFRVKRIGNSSITCEVGIFLKGESQAAAWGHMVHVWVDRESNKPVPIPDAVRNGLSLAMSEVISASTRQ
jgi:acyl-CoA thioester hydrolase